MVTTNSSTAAIARNSLMDILSSFSSSARVTLI